VMEIVVKIKILGVILVIVVCGISTVPPLGVHSSCVLPMVATTAGLKEVGPSPTPTTSPTPIATLVVVVLRERNESERRASSSS
jgi:hypothetical protein